MRTVFFAEPIIRSACAKMGSMPDAPTDEFTTAVSAASHVQGAKSKPAGVLSGASSPPLAASSPH